MDSDYQSLMTKARLNQARAEYQPLRHQHADAPSNDNVLLSAAKAIGFKARQINPEYFARYRQRHDCQIAEATSALDYESEDAIISIAHRLNTIRHCDRILVIESGQISESGCHQTLLDRQEKYAR